jgi:uncharacterized membrane protein YphA (DoxX/SURF4 family)
MQNTTQWSVGHKLIFYFCFIFFVCNIFPFPINTLPFLDFFYNPLDELFWNPIIQFWGKYLFNLPEITVRPNGSGDTTWNWIQQFSILTLATIGTIIWAIVAKNYENHEKLSGWFKIYLRYYLAYTMLLYGIVKIFPLQFGNITTYRLYERLGDMSPMGLLWTFMAQSEGYQFFSGMAEIIGGCLLFFRRTTTLGAIVCAGVLVNIFALNVFYDVPVKIYSFWLLLIAVYLFSDDAKRLLQFFVLNQGVDKKLEPNLFSTKWLKVSRLVLKVLFIVVIGGYQFYESWQRVQYKEAPKTAIYGPYQVEKFERNGISNPSDTLRWQEVFIDRRGTYNILFVTNEDGLRKRVDFDRDPKNHRIFITDYTKAVTDTNHYAFEYVQADSSSLFIKGKLKDDSLKVSMKKMNMSKFLLPSRGFHWINEFPLNK